MNASRSYGTVATVLWSENGRGTECVNPFFILTYDPFLCSVLGCRRYRYWQSMPSNTVRYTIYDVRYICMGTVRTVRYKYKIARTGTILAR